MKQSKDCQELNKKGAPIFSVITVCYNSAKTIAETMNSVLSQSVENIEYIIIDGASVDDTIMIVESYQDARIKLISEPDKGLYDAMNKGIALSSGKYIAILNSDDIFVDSNVLRDVLSGFELGGTEAVVGNLYYFKSEATQKARLYDCGELLSLNQWKNGWHPPHPTTFFTKSIYKKYGKFDLAFPISADYDFMFRVLYVNKVDLLKIPRFLVAMREGGESTRSIGAYIRANREVCSVWNKYSLRLPLLFPIRKVLTKIYFHFRPYLSRCAF